MYLEQDTPRPLEREQRVRETESGLQMIYDDTA